MRIIKLAFISLIFFVVVITILSLFIPSHIRISRNVRIDNSKEIVMPLLNDPVKWRTWYPGAATDSFVYANDKIIGIILNETKKQYLTIKEIKEDQVETIYGDHNPPITSVWRIIPERDSGKVTVQWYMDFKLHWYPWEKFSSLLYDKSYGTQMEIGLSGLKKLAE